MNVLLINVGDGRIKANNPPLGIGYIAAYLQKFTSDNVKISDLAIESFTDNIDFYKQFNPDLVGISSLTSTYARAERLAYKIKQFISPHICIGGPHVSALPEESSLKDCFDSVVVGQGEESFLQLRNELLSGTIKTKIRKQVHQIKDIDSLPYPDRSLFSLDKYDFKIGGYRATSIITSRGCPYNCIYCDKSVFGYKIKKRSAKKVVEEIDMIVDTFGIRGFRFFDDTFTLDPLMVKEFCELVKEKDIVWNCITRADCVDKELISIMKEAGCHEISVGVESGDGEILVKIRKGISKKQIINCIRWIKEEGIQCKTFFIMGFPWDTEETLDKTIDFAIQLDSDRIQFSVATPFPGTGLRRELVRLQIPVSDNWEDYTFSNNGSIAPTYDGLFLTRTQVEKKVEQARKLFRGKE